MAHVKKAKWSEDQYGPSGSVWVANKHGVAFDFDFPLPSTPLLRSYFVFFADAHLTGLDLSIPYTHAYTHIHMYIYLAYDFQERDPCPRSIIVLLISVALIPSSSRKASPSRMTTRWSDQLNGVLNVEAMLVMFISCMSWYTPGRSLWPAVARARQKLTNKARGPVAMVESNRKEVNDGSNCIADSHCKSWKLYICWTE